MRCHGLMSLLLALSAGSLRAQGFEGTLTLKLPGSTVPELTYKIKGGRSLASHLTSNPRIGEFEAKYYLDREANTNTFLMPVPGMAANGTGNGDVAGVKMVRPLVSTVDQANAAMVAGTKPKKLGTTQTVAGFTCEDYELPDGARTHACLATGFGVFAYPDVALNLVITTYGPPAPPPIASTDESFPGMMAAMRAANEAARVSGTRSEGIVFSRTSNGVEVVTIGGQTYIVGGDGVPISAASVAAAGGRGRTATSGVAPQWARTIGDLGFPLRVWSVNGTTLLELVRATPSPVEDRVLAVPPGYQQMEIPAAGIQPASALSGGRGGGR